MNNNLSPIGSLKPFTRFCCTIGNLPSSYMTSLTYEEQLLWLCDYLKNTVIPAVNQNAGAVAELQQLYLQLKDYVDNYFKNLDIQTEINNKLDEMAKDGTLAKIIEDYASIPELQQDINNLENLVNSNYNTLNNVIVSNYNTLNTKTDNQQNQIFNINEEVQNNTSSISDINTKINSLSSGSPAGVYPTLAALQSDDPDHSKIYIVAENGNWYYYDNGWKSGGVYQASQNLNEIDLLNSNMSNIITDTSNTFNNNSLINYTLDIEQGRYITQNNSYIKPNDPPDTLILRCRIKNPILFNVNVKIKCIEGYQVNIFIIDNNGNIIQNLPFAKGYTIQANKKFVLTIKKEDNTQIFPENYKDYISITAMNQIYLNNINFPRFSSGSYVNDVFNKPLTFNDSPQALDIRTCLVNTINKPFKFSLKNGYVCDIFSLMYNNNLGANLTTTSSHNIQAQRVLINIRHSNNENINLEDLPDIINFDFYDGFVFEQGGSNITPQNEFWANNEAVALPIRLRSNPTTIKNPCKIVAKEGYSFTIRDFNENNITSQTVVTGWVKSYILPAGRYNIDIKNDTSENIFATFVEDYIDIQYLNEIKKDYNVLFIGDSITEHNNTSSYNWTNSLNALCNFKSVTNIATGGTGIVAGGNNNWYNKIDNLERTDFDLILIMGNMNDYSNFIFDNSSLGNFGDNSLSTEYGAINVFLQKLINKFPLAKIGWITSTPRQYNDSSTPILNQVGYLAGKNSVFYNANQAIIETCHNYSIPVLDLFNNSNFNVLNNTFKNYYFADTNNSVHPNEKGYDIISNKINAFVVNNF